MQTNSTAKSHSTAAPPPNPDLLRVQWPREEAWPMDQTLATFGLEERASRFHEIWRERAALRQAPAPIIGVAGLLNAGKSTLVRGFLSPEGRERVLAGIPELAATQRFVFWLPARWKEEPAVWQAFQENMEAVFGNQWEWLADATEEAHLQYRAQGACSEKFPIPLVAFDSRLDDLGFGLLDCPDFERAHPGVDGEDTARVRREFLGRAGRLMSAVLIVAEASKVYSENVSLLTGDGFGLQGKPCFLLVNKVRPGTADGSEPAENVTPLHSEQTIRKYLGQLNNTPLFAAYDFDVRDVETLIPRPPEHEGWSADAPVAFEVSHTQSENQPEAVGSDRFLHNHLARLDPADLWGKQLQRKDQELNQHIDGLQEKLGKAVATKGKDLERKRTDLQQFLRGKISKNDSLKLIMNENMAKQLTGAIFNAAPWYAQPSMVMIHGLREAREWVLSTGDRLRAAWNPSEALKAKAKEAANRVKADPSLDFLEVKQLADSSVESGLVPEHADPAKLEESWRAIKESAAGVEIDLPADELNALAVELWNAAPFWTKVKLSTVGPVAAAFTLMALFLFPVDGGSSTVLVANTAASVLASLGLGVVGGAWSGHQLDQFLKKIYVIRIYEQMLGTAFDAFGLPREMGSPLTDQFEETGHVTLNLAAEPSDPPSPAILPLVKNGMLAEVIDEGFTALRRAAAEGHDSKPEGTSA